MPDLLPLTDQQRENVERQLAKKRRRMTRSQKKKLKKAAKLRRYETLEVSINETWEDASMASIVIVKRQPNRRYAVGSAVVDLGCLGIKDAFLATGLTQDDYDTVKSKYTRGFNPTEIEPECAAKIIWEGVVLRVELGFDLPEEFFELNALLRGYDRTECDMEVPIGQNGKLFLAPGPYDDVGAITEKLSETVGSDGFEIGGFV